MYRSLPPYIVCVLYVPLVPLIIVYILIIHIWYRGLRKVAVTSGTGVNIRNNPEQSGTNTTNRNKKLKKSIVFVRK